jgi:fibronectin-binding autotransporter adhesin
MNSPRKRISKSLLAILLPCALVLGSTLKGHADSSTDDTWTGGGTPTGTEYLWSDGNNWDAGIPTDGTTTSITFSGTSGLNSYEDIFPPANTYAFFLQSLTFDSTAGAFTLDGEEFAVFGSQNYLGAITSNSSSTETIDNNITLGGDSGFLANASGDLVMNGLINGNGHNVGFLVGSTGALTQTGAVSGSGIVIFDGTSANINVNGANTYTGQTEIFGGTVNLGSSVIAGQNGAFGNVAQSDAAEFILMGTTGAPGLTASLLTNGAGQVIERDIDILSPTSGVSNMTIGNGLSGTTSTYSGITTLGSVNAAGQGVTLTAAANSEFVVTGNIQRNSGITGTGDTVTKTGAGTVVLDNVTNYSGGTTVTDGTMLVTGTAYQAGAYTVESGAKFGGAGGTINSNGSSVTLASGAGLDISGQKTGFAVAPGTFTLDLNGGALDISQAVTGLSQSLSFALATPSTSDEVLMGSGSALDIGTALMGINDFSFTIKSGFGAGDYLLFDTSSADEINGSLGADVVGLVDGHLATLTEKADSSGNEAIYLDVSNVPEPSEAALILCGLAFLGGVLRHRQRSAKLN